MRIEELAGTTSRQTRRSDGSDLGQALPLRKKGDGGHRADCGDSPQPGDTQLGPRAGTERGAEQRPQRLFLRGRPQ